MSEPHTRREFLDTLLYTSLAATALSVFVPVPFYLAPAPRRRRAPVTAGRADALAEGEGVAIVYGGEPAIALRIQGRVVAFSRVCSHRSCAVNWVAEKTQFDCPCHGAVFDREGRPVKGPAEAPLESLPCRVDGKGEVIVGG